jgi:hypothetical protein
MQPHAFGGRAWQGTGLVNRFNPEPEKRGLPRKRFEDWPVMSTMWRGMTLMPYNFFPYNPALTIRNPG